MSGKLKIRWTRRSSFCIRCYWIRHTKAIGSHFNVKVWCRTVSQCRNMVFHSHEIRSISRKQLRKSGIMNFYIVSSSENKSHNKSLRVYKDIPWHWNGVTLKWLPIISVLRASHPTYPTWATTKYSIATWCISTHGVFSLY
jgi:hypothetical protein